MPSTDWAMPFTRPWRQAQTRQISPSDRHLGRGPIGGQRPQPRAIAPADRFSPHQPIFERPASRPVDRRPRLGVARRAGDGPADARVGEGAADADGTLQAPPTHGYVGALEPTLLALAGGTADGKAFDGLSLMPVLTGASGTVRSAEVATGFEVSGNAALFKGSYKLVRNLAPYGDGVCCAY